MSSRKAAAEDSVSPTAPSMPFFGMDAPAKLYGEMMSFAAQRLRAQAEFFEGLADCQDPVNLMGHQVKFLHATLEAYSGEAGKSWKLLQDKAAFPWPQA